MSDENPIENAAREYCARLLKSKTALMLPPDLADAFAILAFTLGAAWALDRPALIDLANAQLDSIRAQDAGRVS
jgi:hypothetical protein